MMGTALLFRGERLTPAAYLSTSRALLASLDGAPLPSLFVASLTGDAVLVGRYQRRASALREEACARRGLPVVRRMTGGRALVCSEGLVALSFMLPHPPTLLAEAIPPAKVINRCVRGILKGLASLGLDVFYPGDDFLLVKKEIAGSLSYEVTETGATLFEAFLAYEQGLLPPADLSGYPLHSRPLRPETTLLAHARRPLTVEAYIEALVSGFREKFSLTFEAAVLPAVPPQVLPEPLLAPEMRASSLIETPIGFLEAHVSTEGGKIQDCRILGDFIAPTRTMAALEQGLAGSPLALDELTARVQQVFGDPSHGLFGVRPLPTLPEAILDATGTG